MRLILFLIGMKEPPPPDSGKKYYPFQKIPEWVVEKKSFCNKRYLPRYGKFQMRVGRVNVWYIRGMMLPE